METRPRGAVSSADTSRDVGRCKFLRLRRQDKCRPSSRTSPRARPLSTPPRSEGEFSSDLRYFVLYGTLTLARLALSHESTLSQGPGPWPPKESKQTTQERDGGRPATTTQGPALPASAASATSQGLSAIALGDRLRCHLCLSLRPALDVALSAARCHAPHTATSSGCSLLSTASNCTREEVR